MQLLYENEIEPENEHENEHRIEHEANMRCVKIVLKV
jgi:hypothetical protein